MKRIRLATFVTLVFSSVWCHAGELEDQVKSASATMRLIHKLGPRVAIHRLYSDDAPAWDAVIRGISSGAPAWLSVADALRTASDAAASEDLDDALLAALPNDPISVLGFVSGRTSDRNFRPEDVCSASTRSESKAMALSHLAKAMKAVSTVTVPGLKQMKLKCLASLRENRKEVESWPSN